MSEPTDVPMQDASDTVAAEGRVAAAPGAEPPSRPATGWRAKALLPVVVVSVLTIVVLVVLVSQNSSRAQDWQRRSEQQTVSITELQRVLVKRSAELNLRVLQVNELTVSVRRSQAALQRSESDVSSLASRQRELANEKAQVEDERAQLVAESDALARVAKAFLRCSDGQDALLTAVLDEDYATASAIDSGVFADCQAAEDELARYQSHYA